MLTGFAFLLFIFSAAGLPNIYADDQSQVASIAERLRPPPKIVEKDKIYVDNYYEPGQILQGNQTGQWWENTTSFGYTHNNITGYGFISQFSRLGVLDNTSNFGAYVNIDKNQYAHFEAGFGWGDVHYMYKLQALGEYSHRMYKDLFWQVGLNYRGYHEEGDSYVLYPGLMYYFGDHWISATFGTNWIEHRQTAYFGTAKGNFVITEYLDLWGGTAFGQRLYDIFGVNGENGVILFGGITLKPLKGVNVKVGGSYGQEEPKFIKRSLIFDVSIKF